MNAVYAISKHHGRFTWCITFKKGEQNVGFFFRYHYCSILLISVSPLMTSQYPCSRYCLSLTRVPRHENDSAKSRMNCADLDKVIMRLVTSAIVHVHAINRFKRWSFSSTKHIRQKLKAGNKEYSIIILL